MYHYVYMICNEVKKYIGVRSSEVPPKKDIDY